MRPVDGLERLQVDGDLGAAGLGEEIVGGGGLALEMDVLGVRRVVVQNDPELGEVLGQADGVDRNQETVRPRSNNYDGAVELLVDGRGRLRGRGGAKAKRYAGGHLLLLGQNSDRGEGVLGGEKQRACVRGLFELLRASDCF